MKCEMMRQQQHTFIFHSRKKLYHYVSHIQLQKNDRLDSVNRNIYKVIKYFRLILLVEFLGLGVLLISKCVDICFDTLWKNA